MVYVDGVVWSGSLFGVGLYCLREFYVVLFVFCNIDIYHTIPYFYEL